MVWNRSYILVTPAKNEADNIRNLMESISSQSQPPSIWVIVNDGSTDDTFEIISEASDKIPFLFVFQNIDPDCEYNLDEHISQVYRYGFEKAIEMADRRGYDFGNLAVADADMDFPPTYFSDLISFIEENPEYGIVSGKIFVPDDQDIEEEQISKLAYQHPRGSGRLIRRRTYNDIGGYRYVKSADSVADILAIKHHWKIGQIPWIKCTQMRKTSSVEGEFKGFYRKGEHYYYLGFRVFTVLYEASSLLRNGKGRSIVNSVALVLGYLTSSLKRANRIQIPEVMEYTGDYKRIFKSLEVLFSNR